MKNNIMNFSECANCGACYNACPVNAINLIEQEPFYKIHIDKEKCISCGKCLNVCPWNNEEKRQHLKYAIGGWNNDQAVVAKSSSGGGFSSIAEIIMKQGGAVFGAVYSEDRKTVYFSSTDFKSLDEIRRSKYVESNPGLIYREIKKRLNLGRLVLFCGTPCQTAGLIRFLEKPYDNLITCDFACGGLPSHTLFSQYIDFLEKKYNSEVSSVNFRPKDWGWSRHSVRVTFKNGKQYKKLAILDPYFYSFVYGRTTIRENCLNCKFSNNHYSDIILADLWKWSSVSPLKNNDTGISLLLANSEKGKAILELLKKEQNFVELDLYEASYNCCNRESPDQSYLDKRTKFWNDVCKYGINKAAVNCGMEKGMNAYLRLLKTNISRMRKK